MSDYIPTAREILFAEFPELFPLPYHEVNEEVRLDEKCAIGESYTRSRHLQCKPRSAQRPTCHTFIEPLSYGREKQRQHGIQRRIANGKRARLPGLILAIP